MGLIQEIEKLKKDEKILKDLVETYSYPRVLKAFKKLELLLPWYLKTIPNLIYDFKGEKNVKYRLARKKPVKKKKKTLGSLLKFNRSDNKK